MARSPVSRRRAILRRFKAGRSIEALAREYGRRIVERVIRKAL